jgi:hypothetical protein
MNPMEEIIKSGIPFAKVAATGFHTCKCPICNDDKVRAGFVFNDDSAAYSCFRGKCPIGSTKYVYGEYIPQKFRQVLDAFGIQIPMEILLANKKFEVKELVNEDIYKEHHYNTLVLPDSFVKYNPTIHKFYRKKLESRHIYDDDYFIGSQGEWKDKLIIPFRFRSNLIGWQGVQFNNKGTFYLKSSGNTDMLYLPDGKIPKRPIIVEGVFDAKSIPDGVATMESTITKKQAYMLRNSKPILIPDRKGSRYFNVAKTYGWDISIPEWTNKDVNDALQKYGKFVIARMIYEGLARNIFDAEIRYEMWRTK